MRKLIIGLTALLTFLFLIPTVSAVPYTWSSAGAGFCFLPTAWTPFTGGVPTMAGDSTTFDATSNIPPMTCGISGYDSETLAASYGSLVRHTADLTLLNGGLSVDNSQWTLGPHNAMMGQFITQCTSGCPILDAKITLESNSYMQVGGEPLNCTVGSDSFLDVDAMATLNCTSGASIQGGATVTSDGFINILAPLDLNGLLDCGATAPGMCDFSTLRGAGSGTLKSTTPGTTINIISTNYNGLLNLSDSALTNGADFVSGGTTYLTSGTSDFLTFADFNIAYLNGNVMNVSGAYLNFTGTSTITGSSHITQNGGQVLFNAYSNISNSTFDAYNGGVAFLENSTIENTLFNTNGFITQAGLTVNISDSTINAISAEVELNSQGTLNQVILATDNITISGGQGLNIIDSDFNITGNANFGTSGPQFQLNIDPTTINISGNLAILENSTVNFIDSIVNVGGNVFIEGDALLNLTNSILNVTGNISLADNSSWLNLTGGNDPLGGSFIDYCYYGLGTPNIHDVGGSIHNAPLGYNQFNSKCFGLNITYPVQSSVHTTSPIFFQVVLFGENATLQTPPSTWELYRMAAPQWLMNSGNFSNYTWAHWQGFNGVATGWHKLIASTNMTVPGAIPLHVIRNGNNSFHRGEVTFYWNGTPIAPSNASTVNVNISINETLVDSNFASGILLTLIGVVAMFAFLFANTAGTPLQSMYLLLVHITLVIVGAIMLKIGAYFISSELLASVMPFYPMVMFIMIFVTFYVILQFIINGVKAINGQKKEP